MLPSSGSTTNVSGSEPVMLRNKKRCRVLFSYQPLHEDELELSVDQVLEFLGEVEDGWWKGRAAGRVGVFPSNFVEMCGEADRDKLTKTVEERNKKNSQSANSVTDKTETVDSTKKEMEEAGNRKRDDERKMSASQRSQIGPESPAPDTAPRLPPKPGEYPRQVLHDSVIIIHSLLYSYGSKPLVVRFGRVSFQQVEEEKK